MEKKKKFLTEVALRNEYIKLFEAGNTENTKSLKRLSTYGC
jgi:hypothetical protein